MTRKTVVRLLILPLLVALLCAGPALAQEQEVFPDISAQAALGSAFTYQGRLLDGDLPANGNYDLEFKLYDAATAGAQKGATITKEDVAVTNGLFTADLNFGGSDLFNGQALWLEVGVRPGPSADPFTALAPRTALNAAPYALSLMPGASISRDYGGNTLSVHNGWPGGAWLVSKTALSAWTSDGTAVVGNAGTGAGVIGVHAAGTGTSPGVNGRTSSVEADAAGVLGRASATAPTGSNAGVRGENASTNGYGYGVYGSHAGMGVGVDGVSESGSGVQGVANAAGFLNAGVRAVGNNDATGLYAYSATGNIITGYSSAVPFGNLRFRVSNLGNVSADGAFVPSGADFAEMLAAEAAVEAGDLLAIGPDGTLVKAAGAYTTTVAGVYSTNPGFIGGGGGAEGEGLEGKVPLAVVGVVPVKASDQNGAIVPGDLLVASDTPGHVMKGTERDLMLGAVVGKALSGLESGTGTISVLVTLQ